MRSTVKNSYPLRKITQLLGGTSDAYGHQKVRLECGHEVWCPSSTIYRARCRHCAAGSAIDGVLGMDGKPK